MTSQPQNSHVFDLCPNHVAILYLWICTFVFVFLFIGGALVYSHFFAEKDGIAVTIGMMVVAVGAAGGFVSALRRIYGGKRVRAPSGIRSLTGLRRHLVVASYSLIPPVVGALAALWVFMMFVGGLVSGPMFPEFACREPEFGQCDNFLSFIRFFQPDSPASYGKVLFWAFVSGFSEKFVDNALGQFALVPAQDGDQSGPNETAPIKQG